MVFARLRAQRRQLDDELLAYRGRERRGDPDMVERVIVVVEAQQQRAIIVPAPFLCQRKPATTQSAVRSCFTLIIVRSPAR
jgi:hypothetical protein